MGFSKIDKGTLIKTTMLTNFQVPPTIFTETMGLCL